jgi:hypothetical protein
METQESKIIMKSKIINLVYNTETNEEILNEFLSTISREQILSVEIREIRDGGYRAFIIYSI